MESISIFVEVVHGAMKKNIWMIETIGDSNYSITSINGVIEKNKIEPMAIIDHKQTPPLLSLPYMLADIFLQGVQKYLEEQGIRTKNENHIEGELIAKKEHLEDMRMIVKKVLKINS